RHDRIVAQGGSAGGLLMGAVANQAPAAFGAIIAAVPFVDVLNTMLDDTLPLTPPEWPEWGNPIASAKDYRTIAAYSPYDNVRAQPYPPILALAGLTDPRVTYWEPAKWIARLREKTTGDAPILFKTNMDAGHGGASGRFQRLEEIAYEYAFALKVSGKALGARSVVAPRQRARKDANRRSPFLAPRSGERSLAQRAGEGEKRISGVLGAAAASQKSALVHVRQMPFPLSVPFRVHLSRTCAGARKGPCRSATSSPSSHSRLPAAGRP
ncbi:MAG: prolyl oligopeptidase family serine peptidase, partial [Pararhizobium sp.]